MRSNWVVGLAGAAIILGFFALSSGAQQKGSSKQPTKASGGDWPMYRHDIAGTGYSPLKQIRVGNAVSLKQP